MGGYMKGLENQAYGIGNQAGSMYDQVMGSGAKANDQNNPAWLQAQMGTLGQSGAGQISNPGTNTQNGVQMPKQTLTAPKMSPYASQGMGGYKDMSQPQQGQDIMSLMSMLQGGQMPRLRRR